MQAAGAQYQHPTIFWNATMYLLLPLSFQNDNFEITSVCIPTPTIFLNLFFICCYGSMVTWSSIQLSCWLLSLFSCWLLSLSRSWLLSLSRSWLLSLSRSWLLSLSSSFKRSWCGHTAQSEQMTSWTCDKGIKRSQRTEISTRVPMEYMCTE